MKWPSKALFIIYGARLPVQQPLTIVSFVSNGAHAHAESVFRPDVGHHSGTSVGSDSDKHLAEIAKMLTNWKFISPYLGISEAEVEAIEEENKTSNERRYALDFLLVRIVCSSVLILAPSVKFDGLNKRLCTQLKQFERQPEKGTEEKRRNCTRDSLKQVATN